MNALEALELLKLPRTPQGIRIHGIRPVVFQMVERARLNLPLDLVSAHRQITTPNFNKGNRRLLKNLPDEFHQGFDWAIKEYLA